MKRPSNKNRLRLRKTTLTDISVALTAVVGGSAVKAASGPTEDGPHSNTQIQATRVGAC